MSPSEALRKLSQLNVYLDLKSGVRTLECDEVLTTDLAYYLMGSDNTGVDMNKLIPFLVTAINNLQARVVELEKSRNPSS